MRVVRFCLSLTLTSKDSFLFRIALFVPMYALYLLPLGVHAICDCGTNWSRPKVTYLVRKVGMT